MWCRRIFATGLSLAMAGCAAPAAPPAAPALTPSAARPLLGPRPAAEPAPSAEQLADARHLLNRCAFGPRPGDVERVARLGVSRWLEEQLAILPESPRFAQLLAKQQAAYAAPSALVEDWLGEEQPLPQSAKQLREETKPYYKEHMRKLATAELLRNISSERQLEAVLTDFWANHFNVYAAKGIIRLFEGDYLERALRPHALGRFSDLLLATARHPAMLLYLDNAESRVAGQRDEMQPGDVKAARRKKARGLNENYARELLELHTLGVDGGYSQADVLAVARLLTGWSVRRSASQLDFEFKRGAHDRGAKSVLGHDFPAGGDEEEGVRLLELLAAQPATARHLARKLCARFVADEPPEACTDAAALAYTASRGEIRQVVRAIVQGPSFWSAEARRAKLKTPLELMTSAARAFGAEPEGDPALADALQRLGAPLLSERVPTGYPEAELAWASSGGMLARMSFASAFGAGELSALGVAWDARLPAGADARLLVERASALLFGHEAPEQTLRIVREQLAGLADPKQRRAAAVALLVGSPEFQRQ